MKWYEFGVGKDMGLQDISSRVVSPTDEMFRG